MMINKLMMTDGFALITRFDEPYMRLSLSLGKTLIFSSYAFTLSCVYVTKNPDWACDYRSRKFYPLHTVDLKYVFSNYPNIYYFVAEIRYEQIDEFINFTKQFMK